MKIVINFFSARFDVEAEPPNPINPIRGQSFLAWLRPELERKEYSVDGPGTEDWGWYLEVRGRSGRYVIGATAIPDTDGEVDWTIQLWRSRSWHERLRRTGHLTPDDELARVLEQLVRDGTQPTEMWVEEYEQ